MPPCIRFEVLGLIFGSWLLGPNWPASGEVDIIENVNSADTNVMAIHTNQGCSISNTGTFYGTVVESNCDAVATNNVGCAIHTSNTMTFGDGFNDNQGGIYAVEWTSDAITMWFFARSSIPPDIVSGAPDPSGWAEPLASFSGDCEIDEYILNQQIGGLLPRCNTKQVLIKIPDH
jgi:hypothetical protein